MRRVRFVRAAEPVRPPAIHDAWGSDDELEQPGQQAASHAAGQPKQTWQQQQQRLAAPILSHMPLTRTQLPTTALTASTSTAKQAAVQELLQEQQLVATSHQQHLPSLHQLCLGVLGRHVTELVEQLDGQLSWLPADCKAALLAVARRRGELTSAVLSALADAEWTQLSLAGCRRLYAADVLALAHRMPNILVLDVTGFEQLAAGGWKQLALAWPNLTILRLGGTGSATKEALKALPHILPGIVPPTAVVATPEGAGKSAFIKSTAAATSGSSSDNINAADKAGLDSWEHALESDTEEDSAAYCDHTTSLQVDPQQQQHCHGHSRMPANMRLQARAAAPAAAASVADCRLKQLRVLVWPDAPQEAVQLVQQRCPRVIINPAMRPDVVTGQVPPTEIDPDVPLDQPLMDLVGPQALQDIPQDPAVSQPGMPIVHIADRFRAAYIQQAARLRDKERRQRKAEQRKQLKSSHALRTVYAWLDEPA